MNKPIIQKSLGVYNLLSQSKLAYQNEDFLFSFAKVFENGEVSEIEEFSDALSAVYNKLKRENPEFEKTYLQLRRQIVEGKDQRKSEREQLAILDPSK